MAPRSLKDRITRYFIGWIGMVSVLALMVSYAGGREIMVREVLESNRHLARAVRSHLEQALELGGSEAITLARDLKRITDPASRQERLSSYLEYGELFSNVYLFDAAGTLTAYAYKPGVTSRSARVGENYHQYPGVFPGIADRVLSTGAAAYTPIFQSSSGRHQLTYLVPVKGPDGKPRELLSLGLFALSEKINAWIQGLSPGPEGYVLVTAGTGRVVAAAGSPPPVVTRDRTIDVPGIPAGNSDWEGQATFDGRPDLLIRVWLETGGFCIWVGMPRAAVEAPLRGLIWPALLALLVSVALGLAGAYRLSRTILEPVQTLVAGIRQVGDGVLSHRIPESGDRELNEAAQAFNQLTERLQRDLLIEEIWREVRKE